MKRAKARKIDPWTEAWATLERESGLQLKTGQHGHPETEVLCPICGEASEVVVDPWAAPTQHFIEDCDVCCHPRVVHVERDEDGDVNIWCERA